MSKTSSERKRSKRDIRREQMAREKRMKALRLWVPVGVVVLAIVGLLIYRGTRPELEGVTVVAALDHPHSHFILHHCFSLPEHQRHR